MAEDRTLRLIVGVVLVLLGIPAFGMVSMMSNFRMMYGMSFSLFGYLAALGLLVLGGYLIANSLKK